ncbi:MAG: FixG Ig-like domain-containing protein [Nanobdellota archaeon]
MVNKKCTGLFAIALLVVSLLSVGFASASVIDAEVEYIKVDGEMHDPYDVSDDVLEVDRGQELPIKVKIKALENLEDVQITAKISGYQYSQYEQADIFQMTNTFDLDQGRVDYKELTLRVPTKTETGDVKLRIDVEDKNSNTYHKEYNLDIQGIEDSDAVVIKQATLSPSNTVNAGRALSSLVRVENIGEDDLDDVTLTVSVPELNIRDVETLDELEVDEKETFEKILLRFPKETTAGAYDVKYTVAFDEYESTTTYDTVTVKAAEIESAQEDDVQESVITLPHSKQVARDETGTVYPIVVQNNADEDKTYTFDVSGVNDWGMASFDPSSTVTVAPGESETAYLYVSADDSASAGEKVFTLTMNAGSEQKTVPLTAIVSEDDNSGLQKALEIGLIALVIVLILIGLVIGFNKLRGSKDDEFDSEDDDAKTYY